MYLIIDHGGGVTTLTAIAASCWSLGQEAAGQTISGWLYRWSTDRISTSKCARTVNMSTPELSA